MYVAVVIAGCLYCTVSVAAAGILAYRNTKRLTLMTDSPVTIFDVIRNRSWDQARALLYMVVPLIIFASGIEHAAEWAGFALAILTPSLASWKSVTGFRTAFQGVIAALQILLVALHLVTDAQFTTWAQIVLAIVGGGVAAANVHARNDVNRLGHAL